MSRSSWLTCVGATLLATIAVATPAQAASAGVVSVVERTVVQYKAATGVRNWVVITRSGRTVTVDDRVAIRAGKGCAAVKGDRTRVRCTVPKAPTRLRVYTFDRNDAVANQTDVRMTVNGGTGNDTLSGGTRGDLMDGGTGADRLYGNGGNDNIDGRNGNDTINGGDGDDSLHGWLGNDTVRGGNGDDHVRGYEGDDRLFGEAGYDSVDGYQGRDHVDGGADDDWLSGDNYVDGVAADVLLGGPGFDRVSYSDYQKAISVDLDGVRGDDGRPGEGDTVGADVEGVNGGWGNDRLAGNAADNMIDGYTGDDTIHGLGGEDALSGNDGRDKLYGGAGDDWLYGNDDLPEAADLLDGGAHDTLGDECPRSRRDTVAGCER